MYQNILVMLSVELSAPRMQQNATNSLVGVLFG